MFELPQKEIAIFVSVIILYIVAGIVGVFQLWCSSERCRRVLLPVVSLAVCMEAVLLIFRAIEIKAVPLTGLFESMIVLTIVFGLVFLFFSIPIRQVWFSSVMVWVILFVILLAAFVAKPASEPSSVVSTPWAISHGIAMVLSAVSIMFATANAFLYLLCAERLKNKKIMKVLGKMPNIEKLKQLNIFGLNSCFVLLTFGLATGFGMAVALQWSIIGWLTDSKIILITASWVLLAVILILRRVVVLKNKTIAYITITLFFMIVFAIIGTAIFCHTSHNF
jgi:ABC-type uncharacterized transport system permease subunit